MYVLVAKDGEYSEKEFLVAGISAKPYDIVVSIAKDYLTKWTKTLFDHHNALSSKYVTREWPLEDLHTVWSYICWSDESNTWFLNHTGGKPPDLFYRCESFRVEIVSIELNTLHFMEIEY